jgi:inhibitor of cysteine peptidase
MQDSPAGLVGAGGTEIWRFRATKAGRQILRMAYVRPWEKGVAPVKIVSFSVVVTGGVH